MEKRITCRIMFFMLCLVQNAMAQQISSASRPDKMKWDHPFMNNMDGSLSYFTALKEIQSDKAKIPIEIFGGYSYLRGDFGNKMTGFPAGAHISALYNLNPHIATGINASTHSKKEGDIKYSRSFIMIEGRYAFQDVNAIDQKFLADIHVLVGYGNERVKYSAGGNSYNSKGSGPAFGTGLSGVIMITTKAGAKVEADYIGVKYKNTDGLNNNLRFSAGLWLRF